jgi:hypothetical protein
LSQHQFSLLGAAAQNRDDKFGNELTSAIGLFSA